MSGNSAFELVNEHGWRRGLANLLRSGLARWFKTRTWWVQCLIWGGLLGIMLSAMLFGREKADTETVMIIFAVFAGIFPAVAVTIIMQDALVGEKREGTAAWVLSKPVTRPAFILSKLIANSMGVLVTMVLVPCALSYALISIAAKSALDPLRFLGVMGVLFISHFFFLSLTLMLGTFFGSRGPVIGIPLAILFIQQNLIGFLPVLRYVLPWNLVAPLGNTPDALLSSLLLGTLLQSNHLITLLIVITESIVFVLTALWRFDQEEL
jgi:ABC-2 type transport system permease protein